MRPILSRPAAGVAAFALCLPAPTADEEVSGACDAKVVVSGQFQHGTSDTFLIANAPGNEAAYRDEVVGTNFVLSLPGLKAGRYTLEIGLVELKYDQAGQRVFDILCGALAIATNLDIFAAAGGMDRVWRVRAFVDHPGDAAHGPLSVEFIARRDLAKLNTFELKDAADASLMFMKVADLIPSADPASLVPPVVEGPVRWRDPAQPLAERVKDLVRRMSLAEKAAQMRNTAPPIPRLGLPGYNYRFFRKVPVWSIGSKARAHRATGLRRVVSAAQASVGQIERVLVKTAPTAATAPSITGSPFGRRT